MNKRMTIMVLSLIIVFGGLIGFNMFKSYMMKRYFANYEPPAVSVSSVLAKSVSWQPDIDSVGNFLAVNGVEVNSEASGIVTAIHFESGQYVQKGDPLISINDNIEQATLKANQAKLSLEKINFSRQEDLYKRGATSISNVDTSRANLLEAEANVQKTMAEIKEKNITAPFTGRLGIREVNLGQYINPGQTNIVSLQSMDPLFLEFYLPEQLYKKIHVGQDISFHVDSFPHVFFTGKISAINSKVDINTHNIQVQATIPNCPEQAIKSPKSSSLIKIKKDKQEKVLVVCDSGLNAREKVDRFIFLPGMFASIQVSQPSIADTVVLPSTAISYSLYGNSVYVITKDPKGRKDREGKDILTVKRVFIESGEQRGNYTVIKSGVKAGQLVVNSGELKLQDGTRVVINNSVKLKEINDPDLLGQ